MTTSASIEPQPAASAAVKTAPVTALIPLYNRRKTLKAGLDSIAAQSVRPTEILIVNDGSDDFEASELEEFIAAYPGCRVIHQANAGVSTARNVGLLAAANDVIALLDSDDAWQPHHIEDAITALKAHENVAVVVGRYEVSDPGGVFNEAELAAKEERQRSWARAAQSEHEIGYLVSGAAALDRLLKDQAGFHLSSLVVDRTRLKRAVFFDENLSMYEDIDYLLRLVSMGDLFYIKRPQTFYNFHSGNTVTPSGFTLKGQFSTLRNHCRFRQKRFMYCSTPQQAKSCRTSLAEDYYLMAQSLSDSGRFAESLDWYWQSFTLWPRWRTLKHVIAYKLLPESVLRHRLHRLARHQSGK